MTIDDMALRVSEALGAARVPFMLVGGFSPGPRVLLHLGLGEKDKAPDWLVRCYEEQDGFRFFVRWRLRLFGL